MPPSRIKIQSKPNFRIRRAAEIWLEMYTDLAIALINEDGTDKANRERVALAAELADDMLNAYEKRWPGVYP